MDRQAAIAQNLRAAIVGSAAPKLTDDEIAVLQELLHKLEESKDIQGLTQIILQVTGAIQRIANS
jgi:hypothetical protein